MQLHGGFRPLTFPLILSSCLSFVCGHVLNGIQHWYPTDSTSKMRNVQNPSATYRAVCQSKLSRLFFSPSPKTSIPKFNLWSGELLTKFNWVIQIFNFVRGLTFESRRKICTLGFYLCDRVQILGGILYQEGSLHALKKSLSNLQTWECRSYFSQFINLGRFRIARTLPLTLSLDEIESATRKFHPCVAHKEITTCELFDLFVTGFSFRLELTLHLFWEFRVWSELWSTGTVALLIEFHLRASRENILLY